MDGGQQGSFFGLLVIVIPIILLIVFFSKKKGAQKNDFSGEGGNRSSRKDEVWKTIKQFLQEKNERGKEIIKTFVAKKPNPLHSKKDRKLFNQEIQAYITSNNLGKSEAKRYKNEQTRLMQRELYCIYFVTKDAKSTEVDDARIIEAEVYQKPTKTKSTPERLIRILGLKNFETEIQWIQPLMVREEKRKEKEEQKKLKLAARELKKKKKKKIKKPKEIRNQKNV